VIGLILFEAAQAHQPAVKPQAIATVRILQSVSASERDWRAAPAIHRRQILVREKDGRLTQVRVIEYE
jgi:hypothetical protein